ncbi:MAG: hypothetical protein ACYTGB_10340 [Planctomycetota bacterium]
MLYRLSAVSFLITLLSFASAGESGEGGRRPPLVRPPRTDRRPRVARPVIQVAEEFRPLATGKYSERMAAFEALLPRAAELADSAKAEARRLEALEPPDAVRVREVIAFVKGCLADLAAEAALLRAWKRGLGPRGEAAAGKSTDMTCQAKPVAAMLEKAGRGYGVKIELSPAARRIDASLDLTLDGSPTLKQFVDWLCGDRGYTCGHANGKITLVPAASARAAEGVARRGGGGQPDG